MFLSKLHQKIKDLFDELYPNKKEYDKYIKKNNKPIVINLGNFRKIKERNKKRRLK